MSAIKFEKIGNSVEKGWHLSLYKNQNIRPEADDQGPYPTCVLHSHSKAGQMSVHRAFADVGKPCDIIFDSSSMINDFRVLNNMRTIDLWLVNPKADTFNRVYSASWILKELGVEATSYYWDGFRRIAIKEVNYLGKDISFDTLVKLLDDGKPVLAIMITGPDFWHLKDDEIYSCSSKPRFDIKGNLLKPHEYHMVILLGHGKAETSGREIAAFQNSHSKEFGKDGCGRLYFDEVKFFFCLESSYRPIVKPLLNQRQSPPAMTDRRHIDGPKWRPKGKYAVPRTLQEQPERTGRADATSTWKSKRHPEAHNAKKDIVAVLKSAVHTEIYALMAPGVNKQNVREGISVAFRSVFTNLKDLAMMINSSEQIMKVATYSANGEAEIGQLISASFNEVGKDGIITVMDGNHVSNELEVMFGLKIDGGYINPYFIANQNRKCELQNTLIFLCDMPISSLHADKLCEIVNKARKDLLVLTVDIDANALKTLVQNKHHPNNRVYVVKVPGSGQTRELNLRSIAIFTGATILKDMHNMDLTNSPMLGYCKQVLVSKNECIMLLDRANAKQKEDAIMNIWSTLYGKEMVDERMESLLCRAAVLKIGAANRTEADEKKSRVTVALAATRSALEAGVVPGDGYALLYASKDLENLKTENSGQKIGVQIIQNALRTPVYTTARNAAVDGDLLVDKLLEQDYMFLGCDAGGTGYVDMLGAGLIEPYVGVRTALIAVEFETNLLI